MFSKYIKYLIGIALICIIVINTNIEKMMGILDNINLPIYFSAVLLFILTTIISSYKWHIIEPKLNLIEQFKSNLVAAYYSVFVPGQLAAEGVKAYRLINSNNKSELVISSILIDKAIGLISLLIVGSFGVYYSRIEDKLNGLIVVLIALAVLGTISLFQIAKILRLLNLIANHKFFVFLHSQEIIKQAINYIDPLAKSFQQITKNHFHLFIALLLGIIFQLINAYSSWVIAYSLGIELAIQEWLWIMTLLTIALILPITIGGIGLREASLTTMFHLLGLSTEQALAFSIAVYGRIVIDSLIGYFVDFKWGVATKKS
jgi:uncharacterized protein (TIRG00374 family)